MVVTNFDQDVVSKSPKFFGCSASFARINDDYGLKYWEYEDTAQDNFEMSKLAAQYGLGPKVGDYIEFNLDGRIRYGYFVEVIEKIFENDMIEKYGDEYRYWHGGPYERREANSLDFDHYNLPDLIRMLYEIGFTKVRDLHCGNVGWTKDGRFVCIDFNECSLTEYEDEDEQDY